MQKWHARIHNLNIMQTLIGRWTAWWHSHLGSFFTRGPTFVRRTNIQQQRAMWHVTATRDPFNCSAQRCRRLSNEILVSQGKTIKLLTPNISSAPSPNNNLFRCVGAVTMGCLFAEKGTHNFTHWKSNAFVNPLREFSESSPYEFTIRDSNCFVYRSIERRTVGELWQHTK